MARLYRKGRIKTWGEKLSFKSPFTLRYKSKSVRKARTKINIIPDFPRKYSEIKRQVERKMTETTNLSLLPIRVDFTFLPKEDVFTFLVNLFRLLNIAIIPN